MDTFTLKNRVRFVTATSLFDGHDAAIHIMRRILQAEGAEVIHLGHNRSVDEVVRAAIEEDVQGIAVSSYQGGHIEYFTYMLELLKQRNAQHIKVFGGGGGVIVPSEIELLHSRGVSRIFSPSDGQKMGLVGMIRFMLTSADFPIGDPIAQIPHFMRSVNEIARAITNVELSIESGATLVADPPLSNPKVIGITGTGGAGKSSLIDELLLRFLACFPERRVAVLTVDPSRKKTGGALLGDRIRLNAARDPRVFVRSMATRQAHLATSKSVPQALNVLKNADFDLIILETAGIGQSDSEVTELADISVYVMTPEFGAPTQLEKIDMLDFADFVAINKFDKRGAPDALRDVRKTYARNRKLFGVDPESLPVFGTCAHHFNDPGTNKFFNALFSHLHKAEPKWNFQPLPEGPVSTNAIIPASRANYLGGISESIQKYQRDIETQADLADRAQSCLKALDEIPDANGALKEAYERIRNGMSKDALEAITDYERLESQYDKPTQNYLVRDKNIDVENYSTSLSQLAIPKVSVPKLSKWAEQIAFMMSENLPGFFPYTAGLFPFKRQNEDPTRMFAGEGSPEQTNKRFHYLCEGQEAKRLSTAFDSVTLYGADPDKRPDIFGKVGNSGVSVCTLDDAKRLYSGFDLLAPNTSVSMTINGPAPTVLAFFFNAAIDGVCERTLKATGKWPETEAKINQWFTSRSLQRPTYRTDKLPSGHDKSGLGFLGIPASLLVEKELYEHIKATVLHKIRGTVQADILKEDQAQNTCIFSTEFGLKMMADIQQYFIQHRVDNFYSVSISGYHMAEAGSNPISQLAFTLANGFTFVEYYLARGMKIDDFAPNLSFFFSNGLDPEYCVIGRVARRIWAVAMKHFYGANARSQKLKYHIQTSGRSLHAQEIDFNDIRTTLQALYAIADNCNSLHTNAYDEAITTPTEESVRRALAVQMIINKEFGMTKNENPMQGSYFVEHLTDIVERAVLKEFEALDSRGGVLGAMETMYQRSKIQEESMFYEEKKHSGELPIIGVNTFLGNPKTNEHHTIELRRSTDEEKDMQVAQVQSLKQQFPNEQAIAIQRLKDVAKNGANIFEALMDATQVCSLGIISDALYEVGGAYRRNM